MVPSGGLVAVSQRNLEYASPAGIRLTLRHKVRPPLSVDETLLRLQDYLQWEIVLHTGESVVSALRIGERHQISFWDSLIVHAAQMSRADILYTEDLNDGQVFDSVRVVSPLTIT